MSYNMLSFPFLIWKWTKKLQEKKHETRDLLAEGLVAWNMSLSNDQVNIDNVFVKTPVP